MPDQSACGSADANRKPAPCHSLKHCSDQSDLVTRRRRRSGRRSDGEAAELDSKRGFNDDTNVFRRSHRICSSDGEFTSTGSYGTGSTLTWSGTLEPGTTVAWNLYGTDQAPPTYLGYYLQDGTEYPVIGYSGGVLIFGTTIPSGTTVAFTARPVLPPAISPARRLKPRAVRSPSRICALATRSFATPAAQRPFAGSAIPASMPPATRAPGT